MSLYTRIAGTGSYLPEKRVSNEALAQDLATRNIETSNEWIVERTGICARHIAAKEQSTSDLATQAAQSALVQAKKQPSEVDLIIVATSTPDMTFPSTATIVQQKLGIKGCPAFDVQAVCTGFIYALSIADAMIRTGSYKCALVIGADTFSKILDFNDRGTCVLFGDGAGAVVVEPSDVPGILATDLKSDGSFLNVLYAEGRISHGEIVGHPYLKMNGPAVYKLAVHVLQEAANAVLNKAGKTYADLDWLIPHQANLRIMHSTASKLHLPLDRLIVTVNEHGNTSAASVPLALDSAVRSGKVQRGDTLLLEGVGGGFTWGAVLLDY